MDQNAKRRWRVVELLVQTQEIEEPEGQPGVIQGSDQDLLDVVGPQRARNVGVVERDFPALVSSHDVCEDRHEVRVVFVIILGGEFGGTEASWSWIDDGICEGSMRTSELHFQLWV